MKQTANKRGQLINEKVMAKKDNPYKDFLVFLDPGHGGINPNKEFPNYETFPAKCFLHSEGEFHYNGWFYEGVWNRVLVARVAALLSERDIPFLVLVSDHQDAGLMRRVLVANHYSVDKKHCLYISTHANASRNHKARGFEVYTTPGETKSDEIASWLIEFVKSLFKDIKIRTDETDGDQDKEAHFYVLRKTAMPAILIEHGFFDNLEDAKFLMQSETIEKFAIAQVNTILKFIEKNLGVSVEYIGQKKAELKPSPKEQAE